ncbi:MAG: hypothetical protein EA355_12370 [Rhodobacteraceae bacterium]|nr:MAG: hypothetical protein EA355_12370 [Paracoccaceae bacterium]
MKPATRNGGGAAPNDSSDLRAPVDAGLVGEHLRRMFVDVEREPLPERLAALLAQLAAGEKPK